jgi:hypothetical protein
MGSSWWETSDPLALFELLQEDFEIVLATRCEGVWVVIFEVGPEFLGGRGVGEGVEGLQHHAGGHVGFNVEVYGLAGLLSRS